MQGSPSGACGREDDGVRWLAILIRQGLLVIVASIEKRYGLKPRA